jgi:hypothetical protein
VLAASIITLMMEAASTSETSVNFYQTTQRNNPEDSHLHTRRRENLKSHLKGCKGVEWIHLAQDPDRWRTLVNMVMNLHPSGGEFLY